jgi:SOS-response transcriptional repressor LexA
MKYTHAIRWQPSAPKPDRRQQQPGELTPRQAQMYEYLKTYIARMGYPPAMREILDACAISSTSVVRYNLIALERHGLIVRGTFRASRNLRLVDAPPAPPAQADDDSPLPDLITYDGHEVYLKDIPPLSETQLHQLADLLDQAVLQVLRETAVEV